MASEAKKKEDKLMEDLGEGPGFFRGTMKGLLAALVLLLILGAVFCLKKVEPWEVGLRYWNIMIPGLVAQGRVDVLEPGYNLIIPGLHQDLVTYDCSIKRLEMSPALEDVSPDLPPLRVRTHKDQDEIDVYVTIFYHVDRDLIVKHTEENPTESGLREAYPDNASVHERGIKAVCPNILQARLGEIMTANQFYSMTSEKRDRFTQRIAALEEAFGGIDAAKSAATDAEAKFLEAKKQLVIKQAEFEAARQRAAESGQSAEPLKMEIDGLQIAADNLEKDLNAAKDAVKAAEEKALALPLPEDQEADGEEARLSLLRNELSQLKVTYPGEKYLLDRATQIAAARTEMNEFFKDAGIEITAVLIWDFKFRDEIEASIMSKVIADEKVVLERALKSAADARAVWQKKVAEANAAYEAELARGRAGAMEIDAEADRYRTEKAAVGDRMILEAQASGKGRINQALAGRGGQVYVGMEYAKALEGVQVIVLPAGGGDGLNPLDLPSAAQKAQPGAK